jgi:hypothetical protein
MPERLIASAIFLNILSILRSPMAEMAPLLLHTDRVAIWLSAAKRANEPNHTITVHWIGTWRAPREMHEK